MLDFISENYKKWCNHKNKVYEDLVKSKVLPDQDIGQVRNKINKLHRKYFDERKEYNKTGVSLFTWEWYERFDELYGHRENANPSYISDSIVIYKEIEKYDEILVNDVKVKEEVKKTNNSSKKHKSNIMDTLSSALY